MTLAYSLAAIIPDPHRAAMEALGQTIGIGGGNEYTVPLSADGSAPATHWGLCHGLTEARHAMAAALKANPSLAPPVPGFTPAEIAAAITALVWVTEPSAGAETRGALFAATVAGRPLVRVDQAEEPTP